MGEVIRFPDESGYARAGRYIDAQAEPATVISLPVIRIDRDPDGNNGLEPQTGNGAGRRRRRRAAR
jgi:hypothetical protein